MNLALGSLLMRDTNSSIHTVRPKNITLNDTFTVKVSQRKTEVVYRLTRRCLIFFILKQSQTNHVPKYPQL